MMTIRRLAERFREALDIDIPVSDETLGFNRKYDPTVSLPVLVRGVHFGYT